MKAVVESTRTLEQRKSRRYCLSAPVFFYWATPNGPAQSGEGMTRDIDTNGAYINSCEPPPVGALVQMDIMLPNLTGGPGAHLTGEGVVLRVDLANAKTFESGFAVSVQLRGIAGVGFVTPKTLRANDVGSGCGGLAWA